MVNIQTSYLGINLKNPVIISSSGLTDSVDKIIQLEKDGAAAVVLKSLFEEQIKIEAGLIADNSKNTYPEAWDYISSYTKENSLAQYIELIEEAKKNVEIPIIASINCYSTEGWTSFAKKIETAGADALEINIFYISIDRDFNATDYEKIYIDIVVKLRGLLKVPFALKIAPYFTSLSNLADQLHYRGAAGLVLFNRFYEPDIDIYTKQFKPSEIFSTPADMYTTLRWVAIISAQVENIDIVASTGIHNGESLIKMILAGAKAVQICSTIYKNGNEVIAKMLEDLKKWMEENNYTTIDDFRGAMNYKNIADSSIYERSQFMKYYSSLK
jgi:dihydroorotate dehydrogenase (fumarate)